MKPFFTDHPQIIWHTWPESIFALLPNTPKRQPTWRIASHTVAQTSYERYILKDHPEIKDISPQTIQMIIDEHLHSQFGYLKKRGVENIFLLAGEQAQLFALRIREVEPEPRKLHLTIAEVPSLGVYPDWGAYREAGTTYWWEN